MDLNKAGLLLPWKSIYGSSPCHVELAASP